MLARTHEGVYSYSLRHAGLAQLVARHLAKVEVAGSNPVARSMNFKRSTSVDRFFVPMFACLIGLFWCRADRKADISHFKIDFAE